MGDSHCWHSTMKAMKTVQSLLAIVTVAGTVSARDERILPLFNVVQFKTDECQATSSETGGDYTGMRGTCLSSTECSDRGGSQKGNCAAGFGVCCVKTFYACGGTVAHNNTYIGNVGYPTVLAAGANNCAYTVTRDGEICQVRLDFQDVVLVVGTDGITTATGAGGAIAAAGGSGHEPPNVSGELTGQHMYVEVKDQDPTITITTTAGNANQKWNIRVQQIPCNDPWKAPKDCTQWFTANTGTVRSYNARATTKKELGSQDMTICIRQNVGMCGAVFTDVTFSVGIHIANLADGQDDGTLQCATGAWGTATATNGNGAVTIPPLGSFCGTKFALGQEQAFGTKPVAQTVSSPVTVKNGPITLRHFTGVGGSTTNEGFELHYQQI